ncbi:DUF6221 family protein [Streptomyces cylindrosporus]|uniref:DUF6221 family protein n=1 Tax=Streptomyces cylindrosporus TaxID=2927583 RepID=A0ABS9YPI8_9ACTN|nr:DUF6221 family protein [Streptomyces cylindrosporus]MCI3279185.1 DUF6221 family protein [Streptomyces cylindrosporus]
MTAQGEDILAWLDNAISVRETAATEAAAPYGGRWVQGFPEQHKDPDMRYGWAQDMVHLSQNDPHIAYQCLSGEIAAHTVLNDPESVLRRCAADRKLIGQHGPWNVRDRACRGCGLNNQDEQRIADYADCPVLNGIAEGYGWTGGER